MSEQSFKLGVIMGLLCPWGERVEKEPVAYLYGHVAKAGEEPTHTINGVDYVGWVLPKLPEWDDKTYPYACIFNFFGSGFYVFPQNADYFIGYGGLGFGFPEYKEGEVGLAWHLEETEEGIKWSYPSSASSVGINDALFWANFDVFNEDGSIFLAKADCVCIPVYE